MTFVDRTLARFSLVRKNSPEAEKLAEVIRVKKREEAQRRYQGAKSTPFTADWFVDFLSQDSTLKMDFRTLLMRCRDLEKNDGIVERALLLTEDNVIGSEGIRVQNKARMEKADKDGNFAFDRSANDKVETAWADFTKSPTLCGKFTMTELMRLTARRTRCDGNYFWWVVRSGKFTHGIKIRPLDVTYLAIEKHGENPENGNQIRFGVELGEMKEPVAYWFWKTPPSDKKMASRPERDVFLRVPAEDVIHFAKRTEQDQTLGTPAFASGILKLRMHGMYELAQIVQANMAANLGIAIETSVPSEAGTDHLEYGMPQVEMGPGMMLELPPGKTMKPIQFGQAVEKYESVGNRILRTVAGSLGLSYVSLGNDLTGVNYSSIRAGILEEREQYKWLQRYLIEKGVEPFFKMWSEMATVKGVLKLPGQKLDRLIRPKFYPRRWPWVDPKTDVEANVVAVNNAFKSRTQVCAENGVDFEDLVDELSHEQKLMKAQNVTIVTVSGQQASPGTSGNEIIDDGEEKPAATAPEKTTPAKKPAKASGPSAAAAASGEVQSTALNGAQVEALADLAAQVAGGTLPLETAQAIATAAFPLVAPAVIDSIFAPLAKFKQKPAEATPPAAAN